MADEIADKNNTDVNAEDGSLLGGTLPTEEVKTEEVKTEEVKTEEVKTEEVKTEEVKTEEGEKDKKEEESKVPETYSNDSLEMPEGMKIDESLMTQFDEHAKSQKYDQATRDADIAFYAKVTQANITKQATDLQTMREEWRTEVKKMPNWEETTGYAKKALAKFGSEKSLALFNDEGSWLSDHPAMVEIFGKIGRYIAEDNEDTGAQHQHGSSTKSPAEVIYPGQS